MFKMFPAVVLFIASLSIPSLLRAQKTAQIIPGPKQQKIGFYQYLPPGYNKSPGKKYPLIIFLHGIGEKGAGTEPELSKINCCGIPRLIDAGNPMVFTWNGKTESFIVLYPQLNSKYSTWQNYYIDSLIKYGTEQLNGDTDRVFLTGLSLGGGGSWTYAATSVKNAKKLAGLVPVVSPCFMTNGCNIANANLPVVAVHAVDDDMADPGCTLNSINSIIQCGARAIPNLIMYPSGGHYVWVKRAYDAEYNFQNPNIYEWMLAQNRKLLPNKKPIAIGGTDVVISANEGNVILNADKSTDPDGQVDRYVWTKLSGPSAGIMTDDISAMPRLTGLTAPGIYKFEVKVIDNRAEWSKDTVTVTVRAGQVLTAVRP